MTMTSEEYFEIGIRYFERGEYKIAVEAFFRAKRLEPSFIQNRLMFGKTLAVLGANQAAEKEFKYVLKKSPDNTEALCFLGSIHISTGKYESAKKLLMQALSLNPANPQAHVCLAECLLYLGLPQEALKESSKAIELLPNYHVAYYGRAVAYWDLGKWHFAEADIKRAIKLDPKFQDYQILLARIYLRTERFNEGFEIWNLTLKPDISQIFLPLNRLESN